MLSTGGRKAALRTGRNVPREAITIAPNAIIPTLIILKSNKAMPTSFIIDLFIKKQMIIEPAIDKTKQIKAIKPDSEKKILNKSLPLAPTARKIPISLVFAAIEVEIKFNSINAAKTPKTMPITRKMVFNRPTISRKMAIDS